VVLDTFNGSGTTGVAARGLGRRYIGIDINPEYIEMAHRRIGKTQPALIGIAP
jgi:DNA modification methylase